MASISRKGERFSLIRALPSKARSASPPSMGRDFKPSSCCGDAQLERGGGDVKPRDLHGARPRYGSGSQSYTYRLPAGLTAPSRPGRTTRCLQRSGRFGGQLMSCDGFPASNPPSYYWDLEPLESRQLLMWRIGPAISGTGRCRRSRRRVLFLR